MTCGRRCPSTTLLAFSVSEPIPDIMGLPGGDTKDFCIFGREHNGGVLGLIVFIYSQVSLVMALDKRVWLIIRLNLIACWLAQEPETCRYQFLLPRIFFAHVYISPVIHYHHVAPFVRGLNCNVSVGFD